MIAKVRSCGACGATPPVDPYKDRPSRCRACHNAWARGYRVRNRDKLLAAQRRYRERNLELIRDRNRIARGIPEPTRPRPNVCECCGGPPVGSKGMHHDHDHETGKFRGWLCGPCNRSIGQLGDNLAGVMNAVFYIKRNL